IGPLFIELTLSSFSCSTGGSSPSIAGSSEVRRAMPTPVPLSSPDSPTATTAIQRCQHSQHVLFCIQERASKCASHVLVVFATSEGFKGSGEDDVTRASVLGASAEQNLESQQKQLSIRDIAYVCRITTDLLLRAELSYKFWAVKDAKDALVARRAHVASLVLTSTKQKKI
ncbi:hypothetical protein C0J52_12444, partial [Blattella germanica]